jgi:hypothetical protein
VDEILLRGVGGVEMRDEEGEAGVEAAEGGGEGGEVVVVDLEVGDIWVRVGWG